jgi:Zn finger protein HypA/HybF involved in hydrogenase expression
MDKRIDVNPYASATTTCDRCSKVVKIENTFLLCRECRKKYLDLMFKLKLRAPLEKIVIFYRRLFGRLRHKWSGRHS